MSSPSDAVETTRAAQRPGAGASFNPMLLGFGLFLAWCTCAPGIASNVGPYPGPSAAKFLAEAALLIGLALFSNIRRRDLYSGGLLGASIGVATVAPFLELAVRGLAESGTLALPASLLSSVIGAWGMSSLYLLWHEQYARRPQRPAWIGYAASFAIDPLVYFVVSALPAGVYAAVVGILPLLSGLMLARCAAQDVFGFHEDPAPHGSWRFPWRPTLLMMGFSFAYYMLMHLLGGSSAIGRLGNLAVALAVLAACMLASDRFDARALYLVCPSLMVCALLVFAQDLWRLGGVGSFMAYASFTGFTLFCAFALNGISFRYGVQAAWLFGIVNGCNVLAHMAGSFAGSWLEGIAGTQPAVVDVALFATVVGIVVLSTLLVSDGQTAGAWGIRASVLPEEVPTPSSDAEDAEQIGEPSEGMRGPSDPTSHVRLSVDPLEDLARDATRHAGSRTPAPLVGVRDAHPRAQTYLDEFSQRCAHVARRYGLTHREEEVLSLLAQGYAAADIEGTLYIAHNTCKGHIRHVYAKLGVHSRDEAAAVVAQT